MRHMDVCSGVGGWVIAALMMKWETVVLCEKDKFCQDVLRKRLPGVPIVDDIHKLKGNKYGAIDVLTASLPCQPFSVAGDQKGVEDDRFLWPELMRIVTEANPRYIVLEQVPGFISILEPEQEPILEGSLLQLFRESDVGIRECTHRRVLARSLEDIKEAGYLLSKDTSGKPIVFCIPASGFDANHERKRLWFVAHRDSSRKLQRGGNVQKVG